ncbi:DUF4436 domain-containing protein [Mycobacterium gordonae]|uniref:DUF4436 domain-containing protein n=1 Tax=Mycobacterium gordonae TaxID=1778 RepID=A0A1X1X3N3_MYCGO|nr:DUF4436 domain-containing protein [Mycobacterium gordonae]MCV7009746.1 DUF4436 domain-containing protein [Mycobacterium gordonae]ODR17470.1 DUF4436 domain-containing protein [Mycobacterium gordonae]ORV93399.1 hypothetical protein AWC08_18325 [Mycobacterium gordonae]
MRWGIVSLAVFVVAYISLVALYALTGMGPAHSLTEAQPTADGTTVTLDVTGIQPYRNALVGDLTVSPGPALLDPLTGNLKEDLTVAATSATTPTSRTWPKGTQPGVVPVSLNISGDVSDWPFDSYISKPVSINLFHGTPQTPERVAVTFVDRLPGWKVEVHGGASGDAKGPYRAEVQRSPSTVALAVVLLAVLLAIAGFGLFVAVQTLRDRRKFQPPMTTWFAAMLFAVIPLRNALPDAPPFGAWVDVTVVLWVIVALVASMGIYVSCWWRHLAPEKPAEPAKAEQPPAAVPDP